jgi:hypothetical protein
MRSTINGVDTGDDEDAVRLLAYRLWEADGQRDGRQDEYWYAARRQVETEGRTPTEPADPHPADEDRANVYNPSPGGVTVVEGKDREAAADRPYRGSPA